MQSWGSGQSRNLMDRIKQYQESGKRLNAHLERMLDSEKGFPDPPTWGYAFTALSAAVQDDENSSGSRLFHTAIKHLEQQEKNSREYSWEFVVFAMQALRCLHGVKHPCVEQLTRYRKKGTRMFNWYLLRVVNKYFDKRLAWYDRVTFRLAINLYTTPEGMILDEFKTRSLQYHAFSLFVLIHIYHESKAEWLKNIIIKAGQLSEHLMMADGTALYLGRGQEQIFGYGALVYSLEYINRCLRALDQTKLEALAKRVLSFQRRDGSFPLVLRRIEPELAGINFSADRPHGWYGYNTLYDYQPFLAYCLLRTGQLSDGE
ncbi:hypothetical protein HOP62_01920 [Halomonas sp. MCCC 1A17488]|uniref:hypothetical protein n=1 Tax=unclassified Halomonas TaxID=2609666 RepID=UPI0018D2590B|nr:MULTISPECIES: hypothetical protein [unclassified Halomonas]MCE8014829.1 hypothetical protein [Halomonas sp. MCCC 1A17488]MCG3238162.1 hypothetical protein [Halomonas sp. MCCC 1A17488]QPP48070.1 hypothetical protein I4484_12480 [Halomonas sp. SS10-MC5]